MRRVALAPVLVGALVLGAAVAGMMNLADEVNTGIPGQQQWPIATTGGDIDGPTVATLNTMLAELQSVGGPDDWTELVGVRGRLVVDADLITNNVAFWTGKPPDEMLVVIHRDRRSGMERVAGRPSENPFARVGGTEFATLEGVVRPLPYAEAMYSWRLTRRDTDLLAERGVYFAALRLVSTMPATPRRAPAEQIDEWGRETAPPPGQQVETPRDLPAPAP